MLSPQQQQLISLLQMSLQAKTIQQAEQLIRNARISEGFTGQLLLIVDNHSLPMDVRQTALVNLKTTIDLSYVAGQAGQFELSAKDKSILRDSILEALIRSSDQPKLVPLFSQIVYSIAKHDYPQHWTTLLHKITTNLKTSQSYGTIYGSLIALKSLVSIYSTMMLEEKTHLFTIVAATFPILQILTQKLFVNFNDQTSVILILILKVFSVATYGDLPPNLKSSDSLHLWLIYLKKILDFEVTSPTGSEQSLKLKQRSAKIVYRFIQHHANPKYDKQYSQYFLGRYAVPFLESFVLQILSPITGSWKIKMDKIAMLAFPYLHKFEPCRVLLDNHRNAIVPIVMARSKLTKKDLDTWIQDPAEFIHGQRQSRKEPIEVLRMYSDSPQMIVNCLVQTLKNPASSDVDKEIYMFMFAELPNEILEKIDNPILIDIITAYIVPLMSHDSELLRARACEVFTSYIDLPLAQSTLEKAASSIYQCFVSGSLPIRTHAANALSDLLVKYDHLAAYVQPFMADILSHYLKLIDTIDSEEVVYSFQSLISKLSDRIQPYAVQIIRSLQDVFYKFCEKEGIITPNLNNGEDDEPEEQQNEQNTGTGCLATIRQVLSSNLQQQSYIELSADVHTLVSFILADQSYSFLEEGLNILNLFIFKINTIPDQYLMFYPILIYMVIGVPIEVITRPNKDPTLTKMVNNIAEGRDKQILNEVIGSIRNYIAKLKLSMFTAVDIAGETFMRRMWQAIDQARHSTDKDKLAVCETLLITLIQNNIGTIDDTVPTILSFVITQLQENLDHTRLRLINLEVIIMCFFYNSELVLKLFDSQGYTDSVLSLLLKNVQLFKADYQKQRLMLGLIRLLQVNESTMANSVLGQKYAQSIIHYLVSLTIEIVKLRMSSDKSESECSEAQQDNSHVYSAANHHPQKQQDDEDGEVEWEDQYNKLYQSPLELEDEVFCLRNFLQGKGNRYINMLSLEEQQMLSEAVNKAEQLKKEALAAQTQQSQ